MFRFAAAPSIRACRLAQSALGASPRLRQDCSAPIFRAAAKAKGDSVKANMVNAASQ